MNTQLKGKWIYRSFRHDPIIVENGCVIGNPELLLPWSPTGVLDVDTNTAGEVLGKLTFNSANSKVVLNIKGHITPATDKEPTSIELIGEFHTSINKIKGFFIPDSDHIVGTILCMANDIAKQPVGTIGPFVLFPKK